MRSTVVVAISLAFFQSTLAVEQTAQIAKRDLLGLGGSDSNSLTCGAQSGLVSVSALNQYDCPPGNSPFNGLTCGAQKGAVNVALLDNYRCPPPDLLFKKEAKAAAKEKRGESSTNEPLQKRLLGILGGDQGSSGSLTCGAQDGLVNVEVGNKYECPGGGEIVPPGQTCGSQKGLVNAALLDQYHCGP